MTTSTTSRTSPEHQLIGLLYGQRDSLAVRDAAHLGVTAACFTDPLCAALWDAAEAHAYTVADLAPLLNPQVLKTAERIAGRPIDEIDFIVDNAPAGLHYLPELVRQVKDASDTTRASLAAHAAAELFDADDPTAALASLRAAVEAMTGTPADPAQAPRPLADLLAATPAQGDELLKDRFLCRGGAALLVGPTGVGKSSLAMQAAILWAHGVAAFGLMPAGPLRILIVQAENDDGDLAEMRDGVLKGLNLRDKDAARAIDNIAVLTEDVRTREDFARHLDKILAAAPVDLLIIDPAFAYLGGDASSQRDVSPFLRNMLNPLLHKHKVGLLLVHHANKPQNGQAEQKAAWNPGDFAYLGAGSAEFANWARAVIALQATPDATLYKMLLPKRGRRAAWTNDVGDTTTARYIAYHREPGVICWQAVTDLEASLRLEKRSKGNLQDVANVLGNEAMNRATLRKALMDAVGISHNTADGLIDKAIDQGVAVAGEPGKRGERLHRLTGKIEPHRKETKDGPTHPA